MRHRKHGWEWTAWMAAVILLLGIAEGRPGEQLVPVSRITLETEKDQERKRAGEEKNLEKEALPDANTAPAAAAKEPSLSFHSQSAVLMDGKTGRVLYGKNEDVQRPMASTTKIMTCILALEKGNPEDKVEVSGSASSQPQVRMGMKKGENYYLKDLLYALMLESYNDSAVAIAEHIGITTEGFAEMMNEKARSLGCENTHFITPNGLDAQETGENGEILLHSTTARDLARIMAYCVLESPKREEFLEITRTRNYSFTDAERKRNISCVNHNSFLDMDKSLLSGKTGFTGGAGYSYVAASEDEERVFAIALLGCGWPPDKTWKWADAKKLLNYGKDNYAYRDVYQKPALPRLLVENGIPENGELSEEAFLVLTSEGEETFPVLLRKDEKVEVTLKIAKSLPAPVEKGTVVGEILYTLEGEVIRKDPVSASKTVKKISLSWCLGRVFADYIL